MVFLNKNADNPTAAVIALDIFTKNWCLNCVETEKENDLVFRCKECEFETKEGQCLVKAFAYNHKHDFPMQKFGSMGEH